jgi:L-asparaginase / beta-aspartyl-peptidase
MKKKNKKFGIVVHGGAGQDSDRIREKSKEYRKGIEEAVNAGYKVLEEGGSSIDAVEAAVNSLEDNPLFNAGRGAAINARGEVEMDASIMSGKELNSGAVAALKNVKNPISLAKAIMINTNYICLAGPGALDYAKKISISLEPDAYFITEHQYDVYMKKRKEEFLNTRDIALEQIRERMHGTVGAVALDKEGNLAAATSSGGTENAKEGRVGDSAMIGIGTYANNLTCAISCTGDGEYIVRGAIAYAISSYMFYKGGKPRDAVKYVLHDVNASVKGDIGVIVIDKDGNIYVDQNCPRMHRGWRSSDDDKIEVKIYRDE